MFIKSLFATAIVLTTFVSPAFSSSICGNRELIIANLAEKFDEYPAGYGVEYGEVNGVRTPIRIIEIFRAHSGTFTILTSNMNTGTTCMTLAGEDFMMKEIPPKGETL